MQRDDGEVLARGQLGERVGGAPDLGGAGQEDEDVAVEARRAQAPDRARDLAQVTV